MNISNKLNTFTVVSFGSCKDLCFALRAEVLQCLPKHGSGKQVKVLSLHQIALIELEQRHDTLVLTRLHNPVVNRICPLHRRFPVDECFRIRVAALGFRCCASELFFPRCLLVIDEMCQHYSYRFG